MKRVWFILLAVIIVASIILANKHLKSMDVSEPSSTTSATITEITKIELPKQVLHEYDITDKILFHDEYVFFQKVESVLNLINQKNKIGLKKEFTVNNQKNQNLDKELDILIDYFDSYIIDYEDYRTQMAGGHSGSHIYHGHVLQKYFSYTFPVFTRENEYKVFIDMTFADEDNDNVGITAITVTRNDISECIDEHENENNSSSSDYTNDIVSCYDSNGLIRYDRPIEHITNVDKLKERVSKFGYLPIESCDCYYQIDSYIYSDAKAYCSGKFTISDEFCKKILNEYEWVETTGLPVSDMKCCYNIKEKACDSFKEFAKGKYLISEDFQGDTFSVFLLSKDDNTIFFYRYGK